MAAAIRDWFEPAAPPRRPRGEHRAGHGAQDGGAFPAPVSHLRTRHRLWRWSDVAQWAGEAQPDELTNARVIAAFNAFLELRHLSADLDRGMLKLVSQALFAT